MYPDERCGPVITIRVHLDTGSVIVVAGQDPDVENVAAYVAMFRDWKPGTPGSVSFSDDSGGWLVVPAGRVVAIEGAAGSVTDDG